jgi:predicted component of type VI protein secretion system
MEVLDQQRVTVLRADARSFPVSFGRESSLNDVVLAYPFVSSYHARVELVEGRLFVRDLGSRNGVCVGLPPQRVPANERWDLTPHGNVFSIGALSVALQLAEVPDHEPEAAELRSSITGKVVAAPRAFGRGVDAPIAAPELERAQKRALDELQALSAFFLDKPLRTEADIQAFARKLRLVLEAFLGAFIPLRDGLRAFERDVVQDGVKRLHPLETAKTVAEVARLLVDWTDSKDGSRALRSIFTEIMSHQVSMVAGVMDGVKALLDELSPERIEREIGTERRRAPREGLEMWPFRFRALWREVVTRHQDFASEESSAFSVVFGPAFAATYLHHFGAVAAARPVSGAPAVDSSLDPTAGIAKTPETHGVPKPRIGPTGTMVVPRVPRPLPNSGPMEGGRSVAESVTADGSLSPPESRRR